MWEWGGSWGDVGMGWKWGNGENGVDVGVMREWGGGEVRVGGNGAKIRKDPRTN